MIISKINIRLNSEKFCISHFPTSIEGITLVLKCDVVVVVLSYKCKERIHSMIVGIRDQRHVITFNFFGLNIFHS